MICPKCGMDVGSSGAFCPRCGTPLRNAAPATPARSTPISGSSAFHGADSLDDSEATIYSPPAPPRTGAGFTGGNPTGAYAGPSPAPVTPSPKPVPPYTPPVAPHTPPAPPYTPPVAPHTPPAPPYTPPVSNPGVPPTPAYRPVVAPATAPPHNTGMRRISAGKEFKLLTMQYLRILMGDVKNLIVCLAFPVVAAIITVMIAGEEMFVYYEGTKSACFVLVSASIWGGLFNSIQTIVKERANIKRDLISGGLRLGCYTGSRAILQLVLCALQSAILCVAFYGVEWKFGNEMPDSGIFSDAVIVEFYISLVLLTFAADTMGLMISSIVRKEETASVMAPYILIAQLIFSGVLFDMKGGAEVISYLMLSRWGMEALGSISAMLELDAKMTEITDFPSPLPDTDENASAYEMFEISSEHLLMVWVILIAFSVIFLVAGNLLLRRVKKDQR